MKHTKPLSAILLSIVVASIVGCAGTQTRSSSGEYITDSWITTKVKAALVEDPTVRAREVNVETFRGTVQLSGFVSNQPAIAQASVVTRRIEGVTGVKNDIVLR